MTEINTHIKYNTIGHEHLDDLVSWVTGEYPDSGLILVECSNGRWFVEVDYGHDFDSLLGISNPKCITYVEPSFYSSRSDALEFALALINKVYPDLDKTKISEYFEPQNV